MTVRVINWSVSMWIIGWTPHTLKSGENTAAVCISSHVYSYHGSFAVYLLLAVNVVHRQNKHCVLTTQSCVALVI